MPSEDEASGNGVVMGDCGANGVSDADDDSQ